MKKYIALMLLTTTTTFGQGSQKTYTDTEIHAQRQSVVNRNRRRYQHTQMRKAQADKMASDIMNYEYNRSVAAGLAYGCPQCGKQHNGEGHKNTHNNSGSWQPYMKKR